MLLILGHFFQILSVFLKNKIKKRYMLKSLKNLHKIVFKLDYDAYQELGPTHIQQRVYDVSMAYSGFYFESVPSLIINSIIILVVVTITLTINPIIAVVMFLLLPFNYFGYKLLNKKLSNLSIEMSQISSNAWRNENSIMSQVDFIKQNPNNAPILEKIQGLRDSSEDITRKVNNYANGVSGILRGTNQVINNVLILLVAYAAFENITAIGSAIFIMIILPYFSQAVSGITNLNLNISQLKAADDFVNEMHKNQETNGTQNITEISKIKIDLPSLVIKDKELAKGILLEAKKGDIIGIIGESGRGKSTLAKLIAKIRHSEFVYINDIPLNKIDNHSYRTKVSYFSQNTPIVTDTIINNINFGIENTTNNYNNIKFLKKFVNLDEMLLENGSNLSGGDKQRIGLARIFIENSDVLILDEPTSSIDSETQDEILQEIIKLAENKIIFLISHDEKAIKYCTKTFKLS